MIDPSNIARSRTVGVACQGSLAPRVTSPHLELLARFDHHSLSLLALEVDLPIGGENG